MHLWERRQEQARQALQAWAAFPADREPRPLVLLSSTPYDGPPLQAKTATLSSAEFDTDRGPRELPAWEVHVRDVPEPFWVLDPATSQLAWQSPGQGQTWCGSTATIDTSGCILRMSFLGDHRAYTDYDAEVLESGAAVALLLTPVKISLGPPTPQRPTPQPPSGEGSRLSSTSPSAAGSCSTRKDHRSWSATGSRQSVAGSSAPARSQKPEERVVTGAAVSAD
jgi:hypothetical protein